jgi:hypothetical protein
MANVNRLAQKEKTAVCAWLKTLFDTPAAVSSGKVDSAAV